MTPRQKLFNHFVEANYDELLRSMPQRDMLHSAYITIYHLRKPYMPTPDNFRHYLLDAYHRHIAREFYHAMNFILPDPLFWLYQNEREDVFDEEGLTEDTAKHSLADISDDFIRRLHAFLRTRYSNEQIIIFNLAVLKQNSIADIASITGWKKKDIRLLLADIGQAIENDYHPRNRKSNNSN